ncbi:MAG: TonB-dependent receptor [Candidatus Aminicenantaceae bacterium]
MMNKWSRFLICISVLLCAPGLVWAQEGAAGRSPAMLDEMVVTATRQEEAISSVPANTSVITEEEIQNSPAGDVPELLRTEAGVHVSDITGNRRSYRVDLRGFGETAGMNTLVLVDGRKINSPDLSGADWTLIPLDRIERIEIIRGGRGSVLYGDNAAGGVINIITKQGKGFDASAEVAGGSYDTGKAGARISGSHKDLSYSLTGSYLTSDGYRDNSDTRAKDVGMNLDYFAGDRVKLYLSSGYHEDKTGLPGAIYESQFQAGASRTDTFTPDDYSETEDYYFKAGQEISFLTDSLFKIDFSYRNREASSSFFGSQRDQEIDSITVSPQMIFREKVFSLNNSLTLGLDFIEDESKVEADYLPDTEEITKENYGIYIHDELYVTDRLSVSAGYRYDEVEYTFDPETLQQVESVKSDESLFTGGITYNYNNASHVYASYSRSFRYPAIDELTYASDILEPQTSDDYEVGFRHYFSDAFYAKVNFFRIDTENELLYDPSIPFGNTNFEDETRREGVEISAGHKFAHVDLKGTYSYTDAEIRGGRFDGNDFPGVPEHQASATATFYPMKNLSMALNGVYVGERPFISDFANEADDQDDYFVANTKIRYQWKKMSVYLNVYNLFNKEYEEYGVYSGGERAYYPSPKINFLLGFTMKL